jgi:nonribosomal peptide synthetase DhbF
LAGFETRWPKGADVIKSLPTMAGERTQLLPLTSAQEGIWFAQRLSPQSHAYNLGEFLEILGPIDIATFDSALQQFVAATDALRLCFTETHEGPRQYVRLQPQWRLAVVDFAGEADPSTAARSWIDHEMVRPFDLEQGPLFRYALLRLGPDRYFWHYVHHHICGDGYSLWLAARRVGALYTALRRGGSDNVELGGSWVELLAEEQAYVRSGQYRLDRDYWKRQLCGRTGVDTLSGLPPARSIDSFQLIRTVSRATIEVLRASAASLGTNLPKLIAVVAALYLWRLTGTTDLTLGLVASGRDAGPLMRGTVGMISRVLPLRVGVDPRESLGQLVRRTTTNIRELLRHQRYPPHDLRTARGLRADEPASFGLTVNVFPFNYEMRFDGHTVRAHNLCPFPEEDFQIIAYDQRLDADMRIDFVANRQRYSRAAIDAHGRRILTLLERLAAAGPQILLHELIMLDSAERARLLHGFNATATARPKATVAEMFQSQARLHPAATAVVCGERSLTYAQLNGRANGLAHFLLRIGVGPEATVGVCLHRSIDLVVALLGILKAGGVYVPIDPALPVSRATHIIASSAARHLITVSHLAQRSVGVKTIALDGPETEGLLESARSADPSDSDRAMPLLARHPAYVIYTSGSTGEPNGVVVDHQALANKISMHNEYVGITADTRYAAITSIGFDPLLEQVLSPLCAGGTCVIVPDEIRSEPRHFATYAKLHHFTVLDASPGLIETLLPDGRLPFRLETLISGGDVLPPSVAARLLSAGAARLLFNFYGPTEVCIDASAHLITEADLEGPIPIGKPLQNYRVYVLDAFLEPLPLGAVGELYVAGFGLARGYLGQPARTASRFVADIGEDEPGARMYRTGDLACWREDGNLEFHGRLDNQVEIQGTRVELGEVEEELARLHGVARAAVVLREDATAGNCLVAYLAAQPGVTPPEVAVMRLALAARLPNSMIPAHFVILQALPLTREGKLDRRALPALDQHPGVRRAPRNEEERMLCEICADLLISREIGIDSNFFACGGNSLLATQLITRVRTSFGCELSFAEVFAAVNLEQLAALICEHRVSRARHHDEVAFPADLEERYL